MRIPILFLLNGAIAQVAEAGLLRRKPTHQDSYIARFQLRQEPTYSAAILAVQCQTKKDCADVKECTENKLDFACRDEHCVCQPEPPLQECADRMECTIDCTEYKLDGSCRGNTCTCELPEGKAQQCQRAEECNGKECEEAGLDMVCKDGHCVCQTKPLLTECEATKDCMELRLCSGKPDLVKQCRDNDCVCVPDPKQECADVDACPSDLACESEAGKIVCRDNVCACVDRKPCADNSDCSGAECAGGGFEGVCKDGFCECESPSTNNPGSGNGEGYNEPGTSGTDCAVKEDCSCPDDETALCGEDKKCFCEKPRDPPVPGSSGLPGSGCVVETDCSCPADQNSTCGEDKKCGCIETGTTSSGPGEQEPPGSDCILDKDCGCPDGGDPTCNANHQCECSGGSEGSGQGQAGPPGSQCQSERNCECPDGGAPLCTPEHKCTCEQEGMTPPAGGDPGLPGSECQTKDDCKCTDGGEPLCKADKTCGCETQNGIPPGGTCTTEQTCTGCDPGESAVCDQESQTCSCGSSSADPVGSSTTTGAAQPSTTTENESQPSQTSLPPLVGCTSEDQCTGISCLTQEAVCHEDCVCPSSSDAPVTCAADEGCRDIKCETGGESICREGQCFCPPPFPKDNIPEPPPLQACESTETDCGDTECYSYQKSCEDKQCVCLPPEESGGGGDGDGGGDGGGSGGCAKDDDCKNTFCMLGLQGRCFAGRCICLPPPIIPLIAFPLPGPPPPPPPPPPPGGVEPPIANGPPPDPTQGPSSQPTSQSSSSSSSTKPALFNWVKEIQPPSEGEWVLNAAIQDDVLEGMVCIPTKSGDPVPDACASYHGDNPSGMPGGVGTATNTESGVAGPTTSPKCKQDSDCPDDGSCPTSGGYKCQFQTDESDFEADLEPEQGLCICPRPSPPPGPTEIALPSATTTTAEPPSSSASVAPSDPFGALPIPSDYPFSVSESCKRCEGILGESRCGDNKQCKGDQCRVWMECRVCKYDCDQFASALPGGPMPNSGPQEDLDACDSFLVSTDCPFEDAACLKDRCLLNADCAAGLKDCNAEDLRPTLPEPPDDVDCVNGNHQQIC